MRALEGSRVLLGHSGGQLGVSQQEQIPELIHTGAEGIAEFLVGDSVDLPTDAPGLAIARLVAFGVESASMPGHVIDLDGPSHVGNGDIGMDQRSVRQAKGYWRTSGPTPRASNAR